MNQDNDIMRRCIHCHALLRDGLHGWKKEHKSYGGVHICMECHSKNLGPPKGWEHTRCTRVHVPLQQSLPCVMGTKWWTVRTLSEHNGRDKSSVAYALGKMYQEGMVEWRWGDSKGRNNRTVKEWRLKDGT